VQRAAGTLPGIGFNSRGTRVPKEEGIPVRLFHPFEQLFMPEQLYVIEGDCAMTQGPDPKIASIYLTARSRVP
jgi:hypothetical protein